MGQPGRRGRESQTPGEAVNLGGELFPRNKRETIGDGEMRKESREKGVVDSRRVEKLSEGELKLLFLNFSRNEYWVGGRGKSKEK
jgi:hypothetical protein